MNLKIPKLYPITNTLLTRLTHAEQVEQLAAGGAEFIQIRDKSADSNTFYREALSAMNAAQKFGIRLLINDRVDIALAVNAHGVHLGQDDLSPVEARKLLGEEAIIGFSTHTIEQAKRSAELPVDYIAIGPIFATSTKPDAEAAVGLSGLKAVREIIGSTPLVAIGGINADNIADVLKAGADSAAVISCLLTEAENITKNTARVINIVKKS